MNQVDRERYLFDLEERLKEEAIRQRNIALAHQANDALQGGKKVQCSFAGSRVCTVRGRRGGR